MSQLLLLNVKFPLGMPIVIFIASTSFRVASSEGLPEWIRSVGPKK